MKTSKSILSLIIITIISYSCNNECTDLIISENTDTRWWILVHPSYGNEGIYLYNETTSVVEKFLPLPEPDGSPHALDFDGSSLWLGGAKSSSEIGPVSYNPIYELNPENGEVLSTIDNIGTEGIATSDEYIYYSTEGEIIKIKKDGSFVESIAIQNNTINDIAIDNSHLYYVYNDAIDPIIRLSETKGEEFICDTKVLALYTLSIQNNNLVVVSDNNQFRRFDINTGKYLSSHKIEIDGWITAIAPYY